MRFSDIVHTTSRQVLVSALLQPPRGTCAPHCVLIRILRCAHLDRLEPVEPNTAVRHATMHVIRPLEPGEHWMWCNIDEVYLEPAN
jgi:hypothetical protein